MPFEPGKTPEGAIVFQPGESGNPSGRPKGSRNLSTILKEFLELEVKDDTTGEKMQYKDSIIKNLLKQANAGDMRAIQEIFDRTEGKAKQEIKLDGIPDPTFKVVIEKPKDE